MLNGRDLCVVILPAFLCALAAALGGCEETPAPPAPTETPEEQPVSRSASTLEEEPVTLFDRRALTLEALGFQARYTFRATVVETGYLGRSVTTGPAGRITGEKIWYDGKGLVVADASDPRFALVVEQVEPVSGEPPVREDGRLVFAIGSPVQFFAASGVAGPTEGQRLEFTLYERPRPAADRPERRLVARLLSAPSEQPWAPRSPEEAEAAYRKYVEERRRAQGKEYLGPEWQQAAVFRGVVERYADIDIGFASGRVRSSEYEGAALLVDGVMSSQVVVVGHVRPIDGKPPLNDDGKFAFAVNSPRMFFLCKLNMTPDEVRGRNLEFILWRRAAEDGSEIEYRVDMAAVGAGRERP